MELFFPFWAASVGLRTLRRASGASDWLKSASGGNMGPQEVSTGFRELVRASGRHRRPKRRPSEGLGSPERSSKRLCRASQGMMDVRTYGNYSLCPTGHHPLWIPCINSCIKNDGPGPVIVSNTLCPTVHIPGSLNVYAVQQGKGYC